MRLTRVKNETSVAELARRLYVLPAGRRGAKVKAAEAALVDSNPALAEAEHIRPGMVVRVPDVEGVEPAGERRGSVIASGLSPQLLRELVAALPAEIASARAHREAAAKAVKKLTGSAKARRLAGGNAAAREQFRLAAQAAARRERVAREQADAQRALLNRLLERLDRP